MENDLDEIPAGATAADGRTGWFFQLRSTGNINHGIMERLGGRDFKANPLPLSQAAPNAIQPGLGPCQGWDSPSLGIL